MPKTATRTTKPNRPRTLTAQEYRVLAEHTEANEASQRKQDRRDRFKRAAGAPSRRWTTDQHIKVADKQNRAARPDEPAEQQRPTGEQFWERQRQMMIHARNRNRRRPWYPAVASVALGLIGQGAVALFDTASVTPEITAGIIGGVPVVAAIMIGSKMERGYHRRTQFADRQIANGETPTVDIEPAHRKWFTEITVGGVTSSAIVYWIALTGLNLLVVLVVLVSTLVLGARYWKANPIGPGVPRLEPPRPEPQPEPAQPAPAPPKPELDEFALRWKNNIGNTGNGKLARSRLTNRNATQHTVTYDIELWSGQHTYKFAATQVAAIASGLGLDIEQVIVESPRKNADGRRPMDRARLTIVTRNAMSGTRYYTGPKVEVADNGRAAVITSLARYRDGKGEARIAMWNKSGMIPTAIFGGTGGGKSAAANELTCGALSTGLLNLIYVDFKGNSSQALRNRARIAVIGEDAGVQAGRLFKVLMDARIGDNPADKLFPTKERPGWMALIDEITKGIKASQKFALFVENGVTTVRSLGIWMVAMSQNMHTSAWHSDRARSAFIKQAISFYISSKSGSDLIHGLTYDPADLPTFDEDEADAGEGGQPVPGWAVHARTDRSNVPALWDWLPDDDEDLDEEPPYRVSSAFDAFFDQPDIHPAEYEALVNFLGPPNADGRWVIGQGGTHQFPPEDATGASTASSFGTRPRRTTGFGGKPLATDQAGTNDSTDDLTDTQRRVFEVIEGGTTKTGDIENSLDKISRATVHRALGELIADDRIHRAVKGEYAIGPEPEDA